MQNQLKKWVPWGIAFIIVMTAVMVQNAAIDASEVYMGDVYLGTTADTDAIDAYYEALQADISASGYYETQFDSVLRFEAVKCKEDALTQTADLNKLIEDHMAYATYGYALYVDGEEFVAFRTQADADAFLKRVKNLYVDSAENAEFYENVAVERVQVLPKEVETVDFAIEKVLGGKEELETYVVEKGDTTWDIANRFGLSVEELAGANGEVDLTRLQIGQTISLNTPKPWFQVVTTETVEEEQPIIGTTYYEKNADMYVGEQKIKTQGKDGLKNVVIEKTYINGRLEQEQVVSEEVVVEPVHTVMLTGSKWREVAASGEFVNPASGVLTSRFGTRWGRMHEGIDIGAPTGTPIRAADAGVVTAARYITGYGYTVILDHGNGINTLYGHASALLVEVGQTVEKNETIARVGTSGSTTGSCLHFEVRLNGEPIDPLPYVNYE